MNRRRFLTFLALSAATQSSLGCRRTQRTASGMPGESAAASLPPVPEFDPGDPFGSTLERARALGKPLLVLTIPEEDRGAIWSERGEELGDWLQRCTEQTLLDLSRTEVLAATSEHVALYALGVRQVLDAGREPRMWLVTTCGTLDRAHPIFFDSIRGGAGGSRVERIQVLSVGLNEALLSHGVATGSLDGRSRDHLKDLRARYRVQSIPGTRWAEDQGCGAAFANSAERSRHLGSRVDRVRCGMASLTDHAGRFLSFYTRG